MSEENHSCTFNFFKNMFNRKSCETVRETIEDLIEEANITGEEQFSQQEQLILSNILCLKDKKCGHAMIPRADIIAFPKSGNIKDLAELMVNKGHSRIPVYGESLDDIIGVVHVIDLVKNLLKNDQTTKVEEIICREVKLVSPSMRVLDLLRDMQVNKTHMAIVINEYGGVDGIVTIEDLLEEIVGDIEDEYDCDEDYCVVVQEKGMVIADARASLDEIEAIAGIDLYEGIPEEVENEIDTLASLVFYIAQRIPEKEEVIGGYNGVKFRIIDVDPRRIKKVMIIVPNIIKAEDTSNQKEEKYGSATD